MSDEISMGQAPPQSNAGRQGRHGCLDAAGLPCGLPKRAGPILQLYQSSHHWLLGWRHRRSQEHPGYHKALEMMDKLAQLGYINYELDSKSKKLTYQIKDWVVQCSGEPCMGTETVYATQGYDFL